MLFKKSLKRKENIWTWGETFSNSNSVSKINLSIFFSSNSSQRFFGIAFVLIVKRCPNPKNKFKYLICWSSSSSKSFSCSNAQSIYILLFFSLAKMSLEILPPKASLFYLLKESIVIEMSFWFLQINEKEITILFLSGI